MCVFSFRSKNFRKLHQRVVPCALPLASQKQLLEDLFFSNYTNAGLRYFHRFFHCIKNFIESLPFYIARHWLGVLLAISHALALMCKNFLRNFMGSFTCFDIAIRQPLFHY